MTGRADGRPTAGGSFYELVELIGEGGMGRVYRAVQHPTGRQVAVKTLHAHLRDAQARRVLQQEAAAAARLRHPNIVELLDLTQDPRGGPVLVMELVEGGDLSEWLDAWPGFDAIAGALGQVLEGLSAAHAAGVVHRDLKPENLLQTSAGAVKIVDFGVAEILQPLRRDEETRRLAGTPLYMAPEQFVTDGDVGPWTDLYALGVMLYELLFGLPPHRGELSALFEAKRAGRLPERELRQGLEVPDALRTLIARLLDPDPRARPRFASEVRHRLLDLAQDVEDDVAGATQRLSAPELMRTMAGSDSITVEGPTLALDRGSSERAPTVEAPRVRIAVADPTHDEPTLPQRLSASRGGGAGLRRLRALPLVGREAERELIWSAAERVIESGRPRFVGLLGSAGAGKSALARWGLGEVERRGVMEGVAAGYDLAGGMAGGLRHALARLLGPVGGQADGGWPEAWAWFARGEHRPFDAARLSAWLGATARAPATEDQAGRLASAAIRAVGRIRPVFLWLDDFGWSRDGAVAVIEQLLAAGDAPVLVVGTMRSGTAVHPDLAARLERLAARDDAELRTLPPFSRDERRRLLAAVVPMEPSFAAHVAARSDETPLLLLHRVHDWIDHGVIEDGEGGWHPVGGVTAETLYEQRAEETLLARRIDRLLDSFGDRRPDAEGVLLRAALLGALFEERVLEAVVQGDPKLAGALHDVLDRAMLQGLLEYDRAAGTYRFDHGLLAEHLAGRLPAHDDAQAIHLDAARGLTSVHGGNRPDLGLQTAQLFWDGGEGAQALSALLTAIEAMGRGGGFTQAQELLALARRWLAEQGAGPDDSARAHLLRCEAQQLYLEMRYDEAAKDLAEAERIFEAAGDRKMLLRCWRLDCGLLLYQDRFAAAERVARLALAEPENLRFEDEMAFLHLLAEAAAVRGDLDAAVRIASRYRALARRGAEPWHERLAALTVADYELAAGRVEEGESTLREIARETEQAGDWAARELCAELLMRADVLRGRWSEVGAGLAERLPAALREGDRWRETALRIIEALWRAETGSDQEVRESTEAMLAAFARAHHDEAFSQIALGRLVEGLAARGLEPLSGRVRDLLEARREAIARGSEEDGPA